MPDHKEEEEKRRREEEDKCKREEKEKHSYPRKEEQPRWVKCSKDEDSGQTSP